MASWPRVNQSLAALLKIWGKARSTALMMVAQKRSRKKNFL